MFQTLKNDNSQINRGSTIKINFFFITLISVWMNAKSSARVWRSHERGLSSVYNLASPTHQTAKHSGIYKPLLTIDWEIYLSHPYKTRPMGIFLTLYPFSNMGLKEYEVFVTSKVSLVGTCSEWGHDTWYRIWWTLHCGNRNTQPHTFIKSTKNLPLVTAVNFFICTF